jgi:hypothetical protein
MPIYRAQCQLSAQPQLADVLPKIENRRLKPVETVARGIKSPTMPACPQVLVAKYEELKT